MKRVFSILAIVLFFLVLLMLLGVKLLASPSSGSKQPATVNPFKNASATQQSVVTDTPSETAISCLSWYLKIDLTPSTLNERAALPQSQQCFTQAFISQWNSIQSSTEGDPVLTVMDYGPTWPSSVVAQTVGQSIRSSDQQVTLGIGDDQFKIIAHLVLQSDHSWKIDSVTKPNL